jgi:threonine dehydrogenase-like Zn-dependent dehydrogenase
LSAALLLAYLLVTRDVDLKPIQNALVLGGGSAGFMAALALKAKRPSLRGMTLSRHA